MPTTSGQPLIHVIGSMHSLLNKFLFIFFRLLTVEMVIQVMRAQQ